MLAVCLLVVPSVYADGEAEYPTVTNATKSDSLLEEDLDIFNIEGSGTSEVTIDVGSATFQLLGDGATEGVENRPEGYTWIGLHFKMPENATSVEIEGETDEKYNEREFDEYFGFNAEELKDAVTRNKDAKTMTKTFELTWQKDGEPKTQTINIVIDLESVVILEQDSEEDAWDYEIYHKTKGDVAIELDIFYSGEKLPSAVDVYYVPKDSKITAASIRENWKDFLGSIYEFEGYYSDIAMTKKFDFSKPLTDDIVIYIKMVDVKKETNPATGDNFLTYVSLSVVALTGALGTGLYLRKVNE